MKKFKPGDILEVVGLGSPNAIMGDIVIFIENGGHGWNGGDLAVVKSIKYKKVYKMYPERFKYVGVGNPNSKIVVKI